MDGNGKANGLDDEQTTDKMKRNFDNKLTDIKKAEQDRRTELNMLSLLLARYPNEAREKLRKSSANNRASMLRATYSAIARRV